jgi:hypothetical protein
MDFRAGYSSDPGVPPSRLEIIIPFNNNLATAQIATITASISATTLTVTAVTGTISFDNNAVIAGTGVTAGTIIVSQLTGTPGGIGTYNLSVSQTVSSESMTVSQRNYFLYQGPFLVCNPDDASFPFYLYAEGFAEGGRVRFEEGLVKSADLLSWTVVGPSHVTMTFSGTGYFASFQTPVRDGVNSWHSTGFESYYPTSNTFGYGKWTSTDGKTFTPNPTTLFNVCQPPNSTGPVGTQPCPDSPALMANEGAAPDTVTIGAQAWTPTRIDTMISSVRTGNQWVARFPIDANFNVLAAPAAVDISSAYTGIYPGPTFLQSVNGYIEDGIIHYYAQVGFVPSSSTFGTTDAATYANGGGLWQQALDYYTEVADPAAAANAAPVGVTASCSASTVTLTWFDALPNRTYRVYRGTTAGSQTTLIGDVTGTVMTDAPTAGSVYYYKVVTLNSCVEQKSRVVSTYVSSSIALVNAHITRALAAGADPTTINRTWLDSFTSFLSTNGLTNNLLFATMAECGVAQSATIISKIFDLGTTRLPRGGDYTTIGTSTTYSATALGGAPAWLNGTGTAQGYFGGGLLNNIRRKVQITAYAIYQKPGTTQATLLASGQGGFPQISLYHSAGTPGAANFSLSDATQTKTATATITGLATSLHSIAGTFDGTTLLAYADAVAGTGLTGLVIPSPNLNPPDALTGTVGRASNVPFLGSGSLSSIYTYGTGYIFSSNDAQFNGGALIVFDKALTSTQISSLDALMKAHF